MTSTRARGRLIAFEGGEATGKSTQAKEFATRLGAVLTREPGGTQIGEHIRALVLDQSSAPLLPRAEALLLAADRAQHVDEVVGPALASGSDVVCDRFSASMLAYQGYGRGLDVDGLRQLSAWASAGTEPDINILLEVPADVVRERLRESRPDRFEALDGEFHARVAGGYRTLAVADLDRWLVIDGMGTVEEVSGRVWQAYESWLGAP